MHKVEYHAPHFRANDTSAVEVRATSKFSAPEVREILSRTGMKDFRQLGCPEWIFVKVLDRAAKKINFRSTPQPAPTPASPDLADRLQSISLF